MPRVSDLVQETTATTGTGTVTLAAQSGFSRFSQKFNVGDVVPYVIEDGANYEIGRGTVQASNTLSRDLVLETLVGTTLTTTGASAITLSGSATVRSPVDAHMVRNYNATATVFRDMAYGGF